MPRVRDTDILCDKERVSESQQDDKQEVVKALLPYKPPLSKSPKPIKFAKNVTDKMAELYNIRQNCKSEAEYLNFEKKVDALITHANREGRVDIEVRFLLEKAKNAHTKENMEKAIIVANQALIKCNELENGHSLKLVSMFILASCYNLTHKLGKAYEMLEQLEHHTIDRNSDIDNWRLSYNYGEHYQLGLQLGRRVGITRSVLRTCGEKCFHNARQFLEAAVSNGITVNIQEQLFPLIMQAKLLLDLPETKFGRLRNQVTEHDLSEAKKILESCKTIIPVYELGLRLKARFLITEAGLYYRTAEQWTLYLKNYHEEKESGMEIKYKKKWYIAMNKAIMALQYASLTCGDSPHQETAIADDFLDYILNEYTDTHRNIIRPGHAMNVEYISEDTESGSDSSYVRQLRGIYIYVIA